MIYKILTQVQLKVSSIISIILFSTILNSFAVDNIKTELAGLARAAAGTSLLIIGGSYLKKSTRTAYHCGQYIKISENKKLIWDNVRFYTKIAFESAAIGSLLAYVGYKQVIKSNWPKRTKNTLLSHLTKIKSSVSFE